MILILLQVESRFGHIPAERQWGKKHSSPLCFFPPPSRMVFCSYFGLKCIDYGSYLSREECSKQYISSLSCGLNYVAVGRVLQ